MITGQQTLWYFVMKRNKKKQKEYKKTMINLLADEGYQVVSGKGSFRQGSCLVLNEKRIVLNNFLPLDLQIKFLYQVFQKADCMNKLPDDIAKFAASVH